MLDRRDACVRPPFGGYTQHKRHVVEIKLPVLDLAPGKVMVGMAGGVVGRMVVVVVIDIAVVVVVVFLCARARS